MNFFSSSFAAIFVAVASTAIASDDWYSGGSLHRATVGQWKMASYSNKLATAADWAITRPFVENQVRKKGSMDALKPFATQMMNCVDQAADGEGYSNTKVSELAAACALLMGW